MLTLKQESSRGSYCVSALKPIAATDDQSLENKTNIEALFDLCYACNILKIKMSSIPHGMFAAIKTREYKEKRVVVRMVNNEGHHSQKYFNTKLMELTPLKYNSKLMNSIWGLYNRYSPHNIKSTNEEIFNFNGDLQPNGAKLPKNAVAKETAADGGNGKPPGKQQLQNNVPKLENFWASMPISH